MTLLPGHVSVTAGSRRASAGSLGRPLAGSGAAVVVAVLVSGCSPGAPVAASTVGSASPAASVAAPAPQQVPLGSSVTLPTDTFEVSHFVDAAAPKARKPGTPATHWAAFSLKHCATGDSAQGRWRVALADGTSASEPDAWPDELPDDLQPNTDAYTAGDCEHGLVYIAMPDGAVATAVVLEPKVAGPARPEVQWLIGRASATS